MIDLSLQSFIVPDILGYSPPFGTKVETTAENRGGLSTRQVNDNIMLPFAKQRAVVVSHSDVTSLVEYDAKIVLRAALTEETEAGTEESVTLTLGDGGYEGCVVTVACVNSSANAVISASNTDYTLLPGTLLIIMWDGEKWIQPGLYGAVWN